MTRRSQQGRIKALPDAEELAARVPWRSRLVPGCPPMVLTLEPAKTVRIAGRELSTHAGLVPPWPVPSWPREGELCGAVVLSSVFAHGLVSALRGGFKFYSRELSSVTVSDAEVLELSAWNRTGALLLWPCVATAPYVVDPVAMAAALSSADHDELCI